MSNPLKIKNMKKFDYTLSVEEAELALRFVSYVVEHASKDEPEDEDGIFISVSDFIKFIPHDDLPILVSLVERYPIFPNLSQKVIDWQITGEE